MIVLPYAINIQQSRFSPDTDSGSESGTGEGSRSINAEIWKLAVDKYTEDTGVDPKILRYCLVHWVAFAWSTSSVEHAIGICRRNIIGTTARSTQLDDILFCLSIDLPKNVRTETIHGAQLVWHEVYGITRASHGRSDEGKKRNKHGRLHGP